MQAQATALYQVLKTNIVSDTSVNYHLQLNPAHDIFKGHFPDMPVMPGVCMVDMVKSLTEQHTQKALFLSEAADIKFLAILNPNEHNNVNIDLTINQQEGIISTTASISAAEVVFFKSKIKFTA